MLQVITRVDCLLVVLSVCLRVRPVCWSCLCGYQWSVTMTDQRLVCEAEQKIARAAASSAARAFVSPSLSARRRSDGNVDKVCFIGKLDRRAGRPVGLVGRWETTSRVCSCEQKTCEISIVRDFQLLRDSSSAHTPCGSTLLSDVQSNLSVMYTPSYLTVNLSLLILCLKHQITICSDSRATLETCTPRRFYFKSVAETMTA